MTVKGVIFRLWAVLLWLAKLFLQGLTRVLKALKDAERNATIGDIVKEGREFQEVFNILGLNQESVSQLEVSAVYSSH